MEVLVIISLVIVAFGLIIKSFEKHQQQAMYLKASQVNEEFRSKEVKNVKAR